MLFVVLLALLQAFFSSTVKAAAPAANKVYNVTIENGKLCFPVGTPACVNLPNGMTSTSIQVSIILIFIFSLKLYYLICFLLVGNQYILPKKQFCYDPSERC